MLVLDDFFTIADNDAEYVDNVYTLCLDYIKNEHSTPINVLQIGAFDGKSYDTLSAYLHELHNWHAVLVEPLAEAFQQLVANYAHRDDFIFENTAIDIKPHTAQLYYIPGKYRAVEQLPAWAFGCSTLHQRGPLFGNNCTRQQYELLQHYVTTTTVTCITLQQLLQKHDITTIDILHIDTEGSDWRILKQLNFEKYLPRIIHVEVMNLPKDEFFEMGKLLEYFGYQLYKYRGNVTAAQFTIEIDYDSSTLCIPAAVT